MPAGDQYVDLEAATIKLDSANTTVNGPNDRSP
jgi:hypothetical protein